MCDPVDKLNKFDSKDFDALLKKWLHHDRLLNDRERYYLLLQTGILAVLSYLFKDKDGILEIATLVLLAAILLVIIWVIHVYYKISQEVDYFYRNAFDEKMSAYVIDNIKIDKPQESEHCDWATGFKVNPQSKKIKNASLSLFDKFEQKVELYFFGSNFSFRNEMKGHPPLMEHRIKLMRGIAVLESVMTIALFVHWFWL